MGKNAEEQRQRPDRCPNSALDERWKVQSERENLG
jgi:hypothetical protein